jgi:transposase InsO family protein
LFRLQGSRRFGYRGIHILLKREGWCVNVKRGCRLYRHAGLAVRKRSRKRLGLTERVPLFLPETPNHAWSMDFVHDGLADSRRIRCLNVVDDCTRESIVIEVDTSISGERVAHVLDCIAGLRALPQMIRADHAAIYQPCTRHLGSCPRREAGIHSTRKTCAKCLYRKLQWPTGFPPCMKHAFLSKHDERITIRQGRIARVAITRQPNLQPNTRLPTRILLRRVANYG